MTLDEAIEHAEWCVQNSCGECAEDHAQLAAWLRELRRARLKIDLLKTLRDGFKADAQKYKAENAKLQGDIVAHALNNGLLVKCVTDRNDALKELVQDFASFAKHVMNQWGIELEAGYATDAPPAEWKQCLYELDMLAERMRELGIEVE